MAVSLNRSLTLKQFTTVSDLAKSIAGLNIPPEKMPMVQARLGKRVRELELADIHSYCEFISGKHSENEIQNFISILTTNVTSFNREPHHYNHFRRYIIPKIGQNLTKGSVSRIWSAGCSEGMELLSAAMNFDKAYPNTDPRLVRFLGTDIALNIIRKAQKYQYTCSIEGQLDISDVAKYFDKTDYGYVAKQSLTKITTFNVLNLIDKWPFIHKFDAIFCRNVVIYFDEETRSRLWPRFASLLVPKGTLYIGHSERITGPAEDLFDLVGTTTYTLK